ncbi:MAG: LemA family protein [Bacillota bacterium]
MSIGGALLVLIVSLLAAWSAIHSISVYNGIIGLHHNVEKAWYNVDDLLKQRHDEIPNLVKICRGYMEHEKEALLCVAEARDLYRRATAVASKIASDDQIRRSLSEIWALAEGYPALQADQTFQYLLRRFAELEEKIADRRIFYNEYVRNYNNRLERFPDKLVADICGYRRAAYFQIRGATRLVNSISVEDQDIRRSGTAQ